MSWMDLSDYRNIEDTAAARINELRDEAASDRHAEIPAARRAPLFKWDRPRRIDDVIDYFGDTPAPACGRLLHDAMRPCEH
jgi:hypothetical protein